VRCNINAAAHNRRAQSPRGRLRRLAALHGRARSAPMDHPRPDAEPHVRTPGAKEVTAPWDHKAARGLRPHCTVLPRRGSHRGAAIHGSLRTCAPGQPSSGERTTRNPVRDENTRGSRRIGCASAPAHFMRRQATGPRQRPGGSSPNPGTGARLTYLCYGLQVGTDSWIIKPCVMVQ